MSNAHQIMDCIRRTIMEMYIGKSNGWISIEVEGYPRMRYLWYSTREAEKRYREKFDLVGKKMEKYYL